MANMSSIEKIFVNSKLDRWYHQRFGLAKLIEHFNVVGTKNILEVGSGIGITTEILATRFSTSHIVAVDYDPKQIAEAKRRVQKSNIFFTEGDATKLTYGANTFDSCFTSFLFHHVDNYPKAIAELYRILKPGGYLYVIELSIPGLRPNRQQLANELRKAGFTINATTGRYILFIKSQKAYASY